MSDGKNEARTPLDHDEILSALKDVVRVQCSDGNWNHDPYMHGMANGLILALSLFESEEPEFLEAPKVWIADVADTSKMKPTSSESK